MKKLTRYSDTEKTNLLNQIRDLTLQGKTATAACKEVGISMNNYYNWTKGKKGAQRRKTPAVLTNARNAQRAVTIQGRGVDGVPFVIAMGSSINEVSQALETFKRYQNLSAS